MKNAKAESPAYVYVMQDGDRTKIGITGTDPIKRKRQITTATGRDIVLRSYRQFSTRLSALRVERDLHRRFGRYRLPGEWFAVPADRAIAAMQEAPDLNLHSKGWEPDMPPGLSALEAFSWKQAKQRGEPYTPATNEPHPSDLNPDGSFKPGRRQYYA